ncbi:unnamed protein product [Periconia digitata]|uniref:Reverse transcriptase domain-containing protein n=1 Tax=Periconia digitata TaxID=1303443 RepID=A0A9W4XRL1_9PLEO|nr:unnamed protein product [Periconia digitata]
MYKFVRHPPIMLRTNTLYSSSSINRHWRLPTTASLQVPIVFRPPIHLRSNNFVLSISRQSHSSAQKNMPVPALSTLQHVTEKKLNKLARHQQNFESEKQSILRDVAATDDPRGKVQALLEGFKRYGVKPRSPTLSTKNLEIFVRQAEHDPSVSATLLSDWQRRLEHELDISSAKYDYTALFGRLVMEWIKNPNPATSGHGERSTTSDSDSETSGSFDTIGRKEMHEQRKEWESYAFVERKVDEAKIESYLTDIFTSKREYIVEKSPLEKIRHQLRYVMDFKSDLKTPEPNDGTKPPVPAENEYRFTTEKLKSCIKGVLNSDLLAGKKRQALVDLQSQPEVLKELVVVLNMDLEELDEWEWEPTPVPLFMRRQLNGKYRVYMDEETHQAILLHFIGKIWSTAVKSAFTSFAHSSEWKYAARSIMGVQSRERRKYFLDESQSTRDPTRIIRRKQYWDEYFMLQLPEHSFEDVRDYNAEDQKSQPEKSPFTTKQNMLRLLTTEMLLNKKLYGEFTVVQSDFKWFGPSFPHATIFTVLKFFGVPEKWLRFFKKFLEAPVVFAQDGPNAESHVRKCGIPMSYVLSDVLSEAVLFCLDFAVNKRTQGANIYRFHDDLWVWGQETTCVEAWDAIRLFTHIMGLNLNEEKTGAALVLSRAEKRDVHPSLPQGKIKWGFLYLDAAAGRWVIDRAQVDEHIEELRRQLSACRSVMAWVQAWNSYVSRFFRANFADPANCFGPKHNEMIIATFKHIQKRLFTEMGATNVTDHLRSLLKQRFDTDDFVPDGFFYFPVQLGGLGVRNPFIDAFATSKKSFRNGEDQIERAYELEHERYKQLEELWKEGKLGQNQITRKNLPKDASNIENEPFMSFEEYIRYPEETSSYVALAYERLMRSPEEEIIEASAEMLTAIRNLGLTDTTYWRWIHNLYVGDMKQRFGDQGLQLGERDLLPLGLVDMLKSEKVRWEG